LCADRFVSWPCPKNISLKGDRQAAHFLHGATRAPDEEVRAERRPPTQIDLLISIAADFPEGD